MLYQSIELAGELDGNHILLPSFSCQRFEFAIVRHRTADRLTGNNIAELDCVGKDLNRDDHAVAAINSVEPRAIKWIGFDLSDADSDHLLRKLGCNLGVDFWIFLTAVPHQDERPIGQAFHQATYHP